MKATFSRILALSVATGVGVLIALPATAQDDPAFEEIVVTTRKKEENLQDIPISVSALSR